MAIGIGEGAEIRKPMAITVIGGVAVASFFTLLVIPVVYSLLDRKQFRRHRRGRAAARGAGARRRLSMLHTRFALRSARSRR